MKTIILAALCLFCLPAVSKADAYSDGMATAIVWGALVDPDAALCAFSGHTCSSGDQEQTEDTAQNKPQKKKKQKEWSIDDSVSGQYGD